MVETHENFNSIVPSITKANDINKIISKLLERQSTYLKEIPPHVQRSWTVEMLYNFRIDLSKIDRVYYHFYKTDKHGDYDHIYELIFRMDFYNEHHYVQMVLRWNKNGKTKGTIFVCLKPNSFFNIVLNKDMMELEKILKFLEEEDGFILSDIYDNNLYGINVQTLKTLYENTHKNSNVLPKQLVNLRDAYTDYMETYKYYFRDFVN